MGEQAFGFSVRFGSRTLLLFGEFELKFDNPFEKLRWVCKIKSSEKSVIVIFVVDIAKFGGFWGEKVTV